MALRVELPADREPVTWVWGEAVPRIGVPAAKFSAAVYEHSTLSLREFEAARIRIAQVNHCLFCLDWRTERDGEKVDESLYAEVADLARAATDLSDRERLAAEYAERFAADHLSLDDDEEFWATDEGGVHRRGDHRAVHVHRLVDRLRTAQPRARHRRRLPAPRPLIGSAPDAVGAVRRTGSGTVGAAGNLRLPPPG